MSNPIETVKFVGKMVNTDLLVQTVESFEKNLESQKRIAQLEDALKNANEKLRASEDGEYRNTFAYPRGKNEPCCPGCFGADKMLIRIIEGRKGPTCPKCKTEFAVRPDGLPELKTAEVLSSGRTAASMMSAYI
jgi:hypothetical protein